MINKFTYIKGSHFLHLAYAIFLLLFLSACSTYRYTVPETQQRIELNRTAGEQAIRIDTIKMNRTYLDPHLKVLWNPQIEELYRNNNYHLLWLNNDGRNSSADTLLNILAKAEDEGLNSYHYQYLWLHTRLAKTERWLRDGMLNIPEIAGMDLLLTHSLYTFARHIHYGRINASLVEPDWEVIPKNHEVFCFLNKAIQQSKLSMLIDSLRPPDPQYELLKTSLSELRKKPEHSDTFYILPDQSLSLNDTAPEVGRVKKRLLQLGDYDSLIYLSWDLDFFDKDLENAVINFQKRHGIKADGIVGPSTIKALNMSIGERIEKVLINMERLRWFTHNPDEEHIVVNIPDYTMHYHQANGRVLHMKVITGTEEDYTPVIKDTLSYLVFNPTWRVPIKIAKEEILPNIKKDTNYLKDRNFNLLKGYGGSEVDPSSVDWASLTEEEFNYHVVQQPGRSNSLGLVKFIFPNHQSIYIHDTPADNLFRHPRRSFSHGCVRVERPLELAAMLLEDHFDLPLMEINEIIESEETTTVPLDKKVPVHFVYFTAWVDDSGQLNFREDIYDFDERQKALMKIRHNF